jgi:hypothetical protein
MVWLVQLQLILLHQHALAGVFELSFFTLH